MCGRYASSKDPADLVVEFEIDAGNVKESVQDLPDNYNVAPTDPVIAVVERRNRENPDEVARKLTTVRWGLVPSWAKDARGAARMINARAETVATTPAYATSFATRRCVVPADGWYEWVRLGPKQRQPYFMTRRDGAVLAFAGLWTVWGDRMMTCSVITTAAVGDLALVHDRMPLVLAHGRVRQWLDDDAAAASTVLSPPSTDTLAVIEMRPVGSAVGDVRNDGPRLIERVPAAPLGGMVERPQDLTLF
jgi:putative SOS response-associated peptidase YedK